MYFVISRVREARATNLLLNYLPGFCGILRIPRIKASSEKFKFNRTENLIYAEFVSWFALVARIGVYFYVAKDCIGRSRGV